MIPGYFFVHEDLPPSSIKISTAPSRYFCEPVTNCDRFSSYTLPKDKGDCIRCSGKRRLIKEEFREFPKRLGSEAVAPDRGRFFWRWRGGQMCIRDRPNGAVIYLQSLRNRSFLTCLFGLAGARGRPRGKDLQRWPHLSLARGEYPGSEALGS